MNNIPKGYKKIKVGIIPEEWEVVRLGEIGNLIGGGTPSTANKTYWQGSIPWISSSDLREDNIYYIKKHRFITKEAISKSATKLIPKNSILIVSRVGVGKVAINNEKLCVSQDFQCLIPKNLNTIFLAYLVKEKTKILLTYNQGTSIKGFVKNDLKNLKIPLPPLKEQEKIAQILTTWDEAISKQEELIKEKEKLKKGLMQRLLSGEVRFKEFSDEWKEVRLGEILYEQKKQRVLNPQNYELLTVKLHCKGIEKSGKKPNVTEKGRPYYFVYKGELLVGRQNFHNGGFGISYYENNKYITSNAISHYRANNNICNLNFVKYYFSQYNFYKKIDYIIGGTGQKEISKKEFNNLKIKLPSLQEQQKIAEVLSTADKEIELLKKELEELKKQKKGLMQRLLTGEVRVKIDKGERK